jgi:3-isopropylmalate/(R)-2-methylmalate dehydratase large subunit
LKTLELCIDCKRATKAENVTAWLVPGSHVVEAQIIEEGILDILTDSGFVLRQPDALPA